MLDSSPEVQINIEENTHITNLCDLLETIWGHGLKRVRENKSPLCAHLMAYEIITTICTKVVILIMNNRFSLIKGNEYT